MTKEIEIRQNTEALMLMRDCLSICNLPISGSPFRRSISKNIPANGITSRFSIRRRYGKID